MLKLKLTKNRLLVVLLVDFTDFFIYLRDFYFLRRFGQTKQNQ